MGLIDEDVPDALFAVPEAWYRRRRCFVCGGALSVVHDQTYVVQRQEWVKIGATSNARRRIGELRRPAWTAHLLSPEGMDWHAPLEVLGVISGDIEHDLHRRFADSHAHGEWFVPDRTMTRWLDRLADLLPVAGIVDA